MTHTQDDPATLPRLAYPVRRTDPTTPPQEYDRLRREEPVCPITMSTGDPAWLVTDNECARAVLSDRRFGREPAFDEGSSRYQKALPNPDSIQNMDPPRHTRVRKLANKAFTANRVELLRPHIQDVTDELIDAMEAAGGPLDLNNAFGRPLPLRIICEMLGVPFEDQQLFVDWTERIMSLGTYTADQIRAAFLEMRAYFMQLVEHKESVRTEDLLGDLVRVAEGDSTLTRSEIVHLGTAILVAGHDTSVTVIASSTLRLFRNPGELDRLRADPGLWPSAVDELIRLDNPGVVINPRYAKHDIELAGVTIPKGAAVLAHVGAASRDESVLEDPDRFDVARAAGTMTGLGHGPHFCIGAALAKAELEIGLRTLFTRLHGLELAVPPSELRWRDLAALGGYEEFPVTW